jgi:arylsulfatase A-like enzyme
MVVDRAIEWLESRTAKPFFLWLHLMDPHYPYFPPAEALKAIDRNDLASVASAIRLNGLWNRDDVGHRRLARHREDVIALYDASIRWTDQQLGRLVEQLEQTESWQDSLFILTGDHGEQFLEDGERYHFPCRLSQSLLAVPLLLRAPGVSAATVDSPTALIDLTPTVFDLLGLAIPADVRARSAWPIRPSGPQCPNLVVSEAIADCHNPWDESQRLGHRLLAIQGRRYKVEINFDTGQTSFFELHESSHEQPIADAACPLPERHRLLSEGLRHLRSQGSESTDRFRLRALISDVRRTLALKAS